MDEREKGNREMHPSHSECGQLFSGATSRERLTQISHLVVDGDFSLLNELPPKQLEMVIQLVCEERRQKLLQVIAKVIYEDLKNR
ncbi:MAG: hypothetical protein CME32_11540 [Gimesia sp.]|nr:hypothetical protein [Gimesia sp.]